jgi:hypothetical protein
MKAQTSDNDNQSRPSCNVNSTFNFMVGGLAIAAAALVGYLAYMYWWK